MMSHGFDLVHSVTVLSEKAIVLKTKWCVSPCLVSNNFMTAGSNHFWMMVCMVYGFSFLAIECEASNEDISHYA
jgi:hypothetical protein